MQKQQTGEYHTYLMAASGPRADDFVKCTDPDCPVIKDQGPRPHCHPVFAMAKKN